MLNFSLVSLLLVSTGIVSVLLFNTNPFAANSFTIGAFYISLLAFSFSVVSLVVLFFNKTIHKKYPIILIIRRSLLFSVLFTGLIAFSSLKVLITMSAITFLIALILLEFFFSSKKIEQESK